MKIKFIYFFICLVSTITLKSSICAYASTLDTNITTSDSISYTKRETNLIKKSNNTITVSNSDEFIDNLSKGNNIVLNNNIKLNLSKTFTTDSAVSINTNGYGIEIASGSLIYFKGPFEFYGSDESNPTFTIQSRSLLSLSNSSLNIDNDNAVGFYINNNAFFSLFDSNITIEGNNSTGIYSNAKIGDRNCYIKYSTIDINGKNSTGIKCNQDVTLLFDKLTISDETSKLFDKLPISGKPTEIPNNKFILDSCITNTIPDNAAIVNRYISNASVFPYQVPVNGDKVDLPNYVTFILKDKEDSDSIEETTLDVIWDDTADYNTIGTYKILGELINPYSAFCIDELIKDFPDTIENTIYIKNPDVLDITYISNISSFNNLNTIIIEFLKAIPYSENNILYYSTDNGETWQEYLNLYDSNDTQLLIFDIEFNKDYLFQYVLSDGTKSNILKININEDGTYEILDIKGDRDSGDLKSNELPSSIAAPNTNTDSKQITTNEKTNSTNILNNRSNHKSSSNNKTNTDNNSFVNDDSNLIIMDKTEKAPTFVNETLNDKNNSIEERIILSGSPDINNNIPVSSVGSNNTIPASDIINDNNIPSLDIKETDINYIEDSAYNEQIHKTAKYVQADKTEEKNYNTEKKSYENPALNKKSTNKSSMKETKQNSNNNSFKKYLIIIGIFSSLLCAVGFPFIKKRLK